MIHVQNHATNIAPLRAGRDPPLNILLRMTFPRTEFTSIDLLVMFPGFLDGSGAGGKLAKVFFVVRHVVAAIPVNLVVAVVLRDCVDEIVMHHVQCL